MSIVEEILAQARKLSPEEERRLASALMAEAEHQNKERDNAMVAMAIVEETRGSIKGLGRGAIIWLAEDDNLSGY